MTRQGPSLKFWSSARVLAFAAIFALISSRASAEARHVMGPVFSTLIIAIALIGTITFAYSGATHAADQKSTHALDQQARTMKIRINLGDTIVMATLEDNEVSRDFFSLLPLSLTLRDYVATEKISELPRRLDTKGAPPGVDPSVGDIAYYAPWGNLAVFYKDAGYMLDTRAALLNWEGSIPTSNR